VNEIRKLAEETAGSLDADTKRNGLEIAGDRGLGLSRYEYA